MKEICLRLFAAVLFTLALSVTPVLVDGGGPQPCVPNVSCSTIPLGR
jgi:hypothetical protein